MRINRFILSPVLLLTILLAACTSGSIGSNQNMQATETAVAMMHETPTVDSMMAETATADAMMMHATQTADTMMHETPTADTMMAETATSDAMMRDSTPTPDSIMAHETPTGESMSGENMDQMPAWLSARLTDVSKGQPFMLSDYKGKVVLVEMMAVWCTTCKAQQAQINGLLEKIGKPANLVTVSLDIDPNEDAALLKNYVAENKLSWTFAVTPKDTAREIAKLYSDQFLNPPSAPMLIIDVHGLVHTLPFGLKSAADLQKSIEPYLSQAM